MADRTIWRQELEEPPILLLDRVTVDQVRATREAPVSAAFQVGQVPDQKRPPESHHVEPSAKKKMRVPNVDGSRCTTNRRGQTLREDFQR